MSLSKQFTLREKVLLVLLSLLLVGAAYFWLVHQPVEAAMSEISLAMEDADMERTVLQVKRQRLEDMKAELEGILSGTGSGVETPDYDNLQNVMVFLNGILANAGDYSLDFQSVEQPEEGNIVRRVINMSFTCPSYADAVSVLTRLHDCAFRCQIGTLSLMPADGQETGGGETRAAALLDGPVQVNLGVTFFESL